MFNPQFLPVNINIPTYDGSPNTLKFFIEQLQNLKSIQNLSEEHILFFLKSKLAGHALQYYISSPTCENISTLAQAHEILRSFFVKESSAPTNLVNFQSIRLLPQESIKNLAYRIDSAARKTYTEVTDPKALGQIKFLQFLTALPADLRAKVIDRDTSDYDTAVKVTQRLQDNLRSTSLLDSYNVASCTHVNAEPQIELQAEINALRQDINKLTVQANPTQQSVNATVCQLCNSLSHTALSCPLLAQSLPLQQAHNVPQPDQNTQQFEQSHTFPMQPTLPNICHFCNKQGHAWADCRRYARMHRQFAQTSTQDSTHRPPTFNRGNSSNRHNSYVPHQNRNSNQNLNYQRRH